MAPSPSATTTPPATARRPRSRPSLPSRPRPRRPSRSPRIPPSPADQMPDGDPPAPAWLDELALEPGPPWLGMGTRNLSAEGWLAEDDDLERDLATKARLLQEGHDLVFAAVDS